MDPLWMAEPMMWGCFEAGRPAAPEKKQKLIKYEHPYKTSRLLFPPVSRAHPAHSIARHSNTQPRLKPFLAVGFRESQPPIILTEGAKKKQRVC
jgi:hypothetical protein